MLNIQLQRQEPDPDDEEKGVLGLCIVSVATRVQVLNTPKEAHQQAQLVSPQVLAGSPGDLQQATVGGGSQL